MLRIWIPYILQRLHEYSNNPNQDRRKNIIQYFYRGYKLIDILVKFQYLLSDDQQSYAIFYYLIKQDLIRLDSKWNLHGMLFVYLGLKFLDFYFSKKQNNVQQKNQIIQAPKQIDSKNVQKYCPKQSQNNRICIQFRMFTINGNQE
ncbi:unnamed protein product [Paramecium sonneborni]|uniref:Uncharacterized protein n=1 Tax=Paramecium sonneborni TaxID=65129 RepID=A0A8S1KUR9_9CILI|nr:unnamed protein product [Paramecium sonneborni]